MRKIQAVLALACLALGSHATRTDINFVSLITVAAPATTHTVVKGETDWSIAKKYGISVSELHKLNPKINFKNLQIGEKVVVSKAVEPTAKTVAVTGKIATISRDDVNIRKGPGLHFESVVQVEKGRTANVLGRRSGWYKIQFAGGTIGWVREDMVKVESKAAPKTAVHHPKGPNKNQKKPADPVAELPETPAGTQAHAEKTKEAPPARIRITANDVNIRKAASTSSAKIVQVSRGRTAKVLAVQNDWYKVQFAGGTIGWVHGDFVAEADSDDRDIRDKNPVGRTAEGLIATAKDQMGIGYRYGGTSRAGFDCSGFVTFVFAKHGVKLPRTSLAMSGVGEKIARDKLQPGDLVFFFTTRANRVSHVGIYIGNNKFIHASSGGGSVRIDSLSKDYYNKRYAGARRVAKFNKLLVLDAQAELGQKAIPEVPEEEPSGLPVSGFGAGRLVGFGPKRALRIGFFLSQTVGPSRAPVV